MIKIFLKSGKDVPVRRFHPWIFSGAVARVEGRPEDGDMVEVYDRGGELLGAGHFHHGSIAVRLLSFGPANMADSGFWEDKLRNALAVRALFTDITATDGAYRLVHGEGDGLSGLIVDVYGDTAVVQCHSIGMHRQVELIAGALESVYEGRLRAVYDKSYESLPVRYAETQSNGYRRV
ncbi:MAG: class I SAM-dependent rRNA methyltransferase, partial [Bacteroidota bacterium]